MDEGRIIHEFMYALGFIHQHNSANRDDWIKNLKKNIKPGEKDQYEMYTDSDLTDFGFYYDYERVMH